MGRFKIDLSGSSGLWPIALFIRRQGLFGRSRWERLDTYETIDKARAHYELIKDLPEYLP